jgi:hypothetical protein
MRQKNLIGQIRTQMANKKQSTLRANEFDFLKPNSTNFIWKHSDKNLNLKGNVYFKWLSRGLYELK